MNRWKVVVPSNRPERMAEFVEAWRDLFEDADADLFIVWDLDELPDVDFGDALSDYSLAWTRADLPRWMPTGTDMIRSWGIYQAWVRDAALSPPRYTLSLDDDVRPHSPDIFQRYEAVFEHGLRRSRYLDVGMLTGCELPMRGLPLLDRAPAPVAVQYGGWEGVPDLDAVTQLTEPVYGYVGWAANAVVPVPVGAAVTGCAMNMAWQTRYAPLVWQQPLHAGRYNRFGDIWAGLLAKRCCDLLGLTVAVNGRALVAHERASDPTANLAREAPGLPLNDLLWDHVSVGPMLRPSAPLLDVYRSVTDWAAVLFDRHDADYAAAYVTARDAWLALYELSPDQT